MLRVYLRDLRLIWRLLQRHRPVVSYLRGEEWVVDEDVLARRWFDVLTKNLPDCDLSTATFHTRRSETADGEIRQVQLAVNRLLVLFLDHYGGADAEAEKALCRAETTQLPAEEEEEYCRAAPTGHEWRGEYRELYRECLKEFEWSSKFRQRKKKFA